MKIVMFGSKRMRLEEWAHYLPSETTVLAWDGMGDGIHSIREYAAARGIALAEGPVPAGRDTALIKGADMVLIFWDGKSGGAKSVADRCHRAGIPVRVFV